MTRQVLFNSAVLTRPGAYTKIDASQFENIILGGNGTVGIIGDADDGPPRSLQVFSGQAGGAAAIKNLYRSGDIVEAAQILADPSNDALLPTGAQQIVVYKVNGGTRATLTKAPFVLSSAGWGAAQNNTSVALSVGSTSNERVLTVSGTDSQGFLVQEISPSLGATGKFAIQYTGAGSAAAMTIDATSLTIAVTGAVADGVTILFADYPTLQAVLTFITNKGVYTVSSLISNALTFDPTYLDGLVAADVKTALTTVYARNFDLLDWINKNSSLIFVDLPGGYTKGAVGPIATFVNTALAGGTRGTSTNTDWVTAFAVLGTLRVNQVVPLASADATATQGTYTYASILAALSSHCRLMSSTIGRSERTGWAGKAGTKTQIIASSNATNTSAVVLTAQKLQKLIFATNQIGYLPEWSFAAALAGMRAGAPLNEPLTHKLVNALGLTQDATWDPNDPNTSDDLLLNGVTFAQSVPGIGFRIVRCTTTYTQSNNDAFSEESIVQIWKNVSFELRNALEARYTGRPADIDIVSTLPSLVDSVLTKFATDKALTPSLRNGVVTSPAFGNITYRLTGDQLQVGVTIQPTPGVNFILTTIALVPVTISS